jgi:hypothetical protein
MTAELSNLAVHRMDAIVAAYAAERRVPVHSFKRHGKLSVDAAELRMEAIRRLFEAGLFRQTQIANYFGCSPYTVGRAIGTRSTQRDAPYTSEEDEQIRELHLSGLSAGAIQKQMPHRTPQSVLYRIKALMEPIDTNIRDFPVPSFTGGTPAMIAVAKRENAAMRKAFR